MASNRGKAGDPRRKILIPIAQQVKKLVYACKNGRRRKAQVQNLVRLIGWVATLGRRVMAAEICGYCAHNSLHPTEPRRRNRLQPSPFVTFCRVTTLYEYAA